MYGYFYQYILYKNGKDVNFMKGRRNKLRCSRHFFWLWRFADLQI